MSKKLNYSLLYVEDEDYIREVVVEYLEEFFSTIYEASNGKEALEIYYDKQPDIVITDIRMPKMNGLTFARKLRERDKSTPIVITTTYATTEYLLDAVELNLIKYLLKPIEEERLLEAINLCVHQIEESSPSVVNLNSQYKYDTYNQTLTLDGKIVPFTMSQRKLLDILIKNRHRAVSYQEIEGYIWGRGEMSESALRSLVHTIRRVISKDTIQNISKIGYKIKLYE
ncbi:response regulator transcription factor [Sulfurovum sp. bin170]|uniref:response regulator transcription factor n=1 Tax=Sulfurovum sp. bin170 TaxID=2695268 RepID=UPI0013E0B092|nr:response regulator [Sulfurovum sp. bin170]NEW61541.1 response regulator transcription factor [Sulfurovum sp. bin170]